MRTNNTILSVPNLILNWFHRAKNFLTCMRGAKMSHYMFIFNANTMKIRVCVTYEVILSLLECSYLDTSN